MSSKSQDIEARPDATAIKSQRGSAKGNITRLIKQLNQAAIDSKSEGVEGKLQALDEAFKQFTEVHDNYFVTLEDQDDCDAALGYLISVECDVQDVRHRTLAWLHDVDSGGLNSNEGHSRMMLRQKCQQDGC